MSFSNEVKKPFQEITTLISIRPRWLARGWEDELVSGQNVFSLPWENGNVAAVCDESFSSLEQKNSLAEVEGQKGSFFFDEQEKLVYANFEDNAQPDPNQRVVVIEWDLFFSTEQKNWHVDPQDSSSKDQVWEAGLVKPPVPSQGNPDIYFGFAPTRVTDVQIVLGEGSSLMKYLHDWSVFGSRVKIWECAGEFSAANISEIFVGVAGSYAMQGAVLSIEVTDPLNLINQQVEPKYFGFSDFPALDPRKEGAAIRRIYGAVSGLVPVNVDYNATPATNANRTWCVGQGSVAESPSLVALIEASDPGNDSTHTVVDDAFGFAPGDWIVVEQNGTPSYTMISNVNYDTNVIEHLPLFGRTVAAGDEVRRGFIGAISLTQDRFTVFLSPERDWTEVDLANGTKGFVLADNFESNLSSAWQPFDPDRMQISVVAYGSTVTPKKLNGVDPLCDVSRHGGAVANPIGILWDILRKDIRTFKELVQFDEQSWTDLAAASERIVGFALPRNSADQFGQWREVIEVLMQGEFLRLHTLIQNGSSKLMITRDEPLGAVDADVSQNDLAAPAYSYSYSDVYDSVRVEFGYREFSSDGFQYSILVDSKRAKFFHRISQPFQMDSFYILSSDAEQVALRYASILGERRGVISGTLRPEFMENKIGDTIRYESKFLTGFAANGQINERRYRLSEHAKSPRGIAITLDDQKGIENFEGDW